MKENQIGRLLAELWRDLQDPSILWQAGVVASCVLAAWWLARLLRWRAPEDSAEALKRGAAVVRRVAFPVLACLLLVVGRIALAHWHKTTLFAVAIPLFASLASIRLAVYVLRLAFPRSGWMEAFERSFATLVWAVVALHLTGLLPEIVDWLSEVEFVVGKQKLSLWTILSAAFWVALTLLGALWAGAALEARLLRAEALHSSLRVVFARLAKALLAVVAVLVVLPLVGVDLTLLSVFGGALGVGLGLGLQKIASNYVSGFIILLDRSIRIGDLISADNQYGEVKQITTRHVVVRSPTGVEAIIPNDTLVTTTVLNHSYSDNVVRLSVRVLVSYATDVGATLRLLEEVARRNPRVLQAPPPLALVVNLADNGVELELGFWISDPEAGTQPVRSELMLEVLKEFRSRGIEIPYPQREVRLLQGTTPARS